jgi:thiamine pyrophosphate-dependent acetolactate synthase large subunit-like protein
MGQDHQGRRHQRRLSVASEFLRDLPVPVPEQKELWGSDAIAAMLRALDIPYLALNPGASYRGLHDSIVNYLGNERPQMLLCLHEESAVAIAHGYAKASGRMMGAVLHSNVGLMHGSMAIFNAWCDRVPMLILGATGPWDAARRRPWIDWIHTAADQGALVRDYTKWDNQPASVPAAYEALMRAAQMANTAPRGPTYINLDAALQEAKIGPLPPLPDVARFSPPPAVKPSDAVLKEAAQLLSNARNPALLIGRVSRGLDAWKARVALAEKLQAKVFTDIKTPAAFPTDHPLHAAPPATFPDGTLLKGSGCGAVARLGRHLPGTLKAAWGDAPIGAKVIRVSVDAHVHRGWSSDYQGLPPSDAYLMCEPDVAVPLLLELVRPRPSAIAPKTETKLEKDEAVTIRALARVFNELTDGMEICLSKLPLGWNGAYRHFRHPLDYLGADGGGGVGAGPGLTVGAALALKGSGRMVVGIVGDGDFLMGNTALWTATHYRLPCLFLVANNRSFYNDELHQERVAKARGRPVENKWIGQRIDEPDIDLAMMARAQGAVGIGPVRELSQLRSAVEEGIAKVKAGNVCVGGCASHARAYDSAAHPTPAPRRLDAEPKDAFQMKAKKIRFAAPRPPVRR